MLHDSVLYKFTTDIDIDVMVTIRDKVLVSCGSVSITSVFNACCCVVGLDVTYSHIKQILYSASYRESCQCH